MNLLTKPSRLKRGMPGKKRNAGDADDALLLASVDTNGQCLRCNKLLGQSSLYHIKKHRDHGCAPVRATKKVRSFFPTVTREEYFESQQNKSSSCSDDVKKNSSSSSSSSSTSSSSSDTAITEQAVSDDQVLLDSSSEGEASVSSVLLFV